MHDAGDRKRMGLPRWEGLDKAKATAGLQHRLPRIRLPGISGILGGGSRRSRKGR